MRRIVHIKFLLLSLVFVAMSANAQSYVAQSVLNSEGTWLKIGVTETGIYKITWDFLAEKGINVSDINKVSLFGNPAGMLPEANSDINYDDLSEIDIVVTNEFLMFYGQSPVIWKLDDDNIYHHEMNFYTDTTYYFLRINGKADGARMASKSAGLTSGTNAITTFLDHQLHELEQHNYYKQGRRWYGEEIQGGSDDSNLTVPFTFPHAVVNSSASMYLSMVGSSTSERFYSTVKINDEIAFENIAIDKVGGHVFGREINRSKRFDLRNDKVDVNISVVSNSSSSIIGLDYIEINAWRNLYFDDNELYFDILPSQVEAQGSSVAIENTNENLVLYNVTDPIHPFIQQVKFHDGVSEFAVNENSSHSYLLVKESSIKDVLSIHRIENQNLHALDLGQYEYTDMLIVTHPMFMKQAKEIANIHAEKDGLVSLVVNVEEIYNEFSNGACDVSGIRNFIRMIYLRSRELKYVLLFGDGSCDYKNILGYGGNFVPSYEAKVTYNETESYVSDDYYAMLDPQDGYECKGLMDVGVGRLPVASEYEADVAVDKIRRYIEFDGNDASWHNDILFVSDDNTNDYPKNLERLETIIDTSATQININKVYEDSYIRKQNVAGYVYPEAITDLVRNIEEGKLIVSYLGHGGVKGLSDESLFTLKEIEALRNHDRLAFFHTGTCEFSKFDNPSYVSAGEQLFLNPNGGAIGMFTTTRPTNVSVNFNMCKKFYQVVFGGIRQKRLGDLVRETKNLCNTNGTLTAGYLCYVLFGDPALKLAYPSNDIKIFYVNGQLQKDVVNVGAMESIRVVGAVLDENGNTDTGFNGYIYPKMYDNASNLHTLNNTGDNTDYLYFKCLKDIVYEGKVSVRNGGFDFSFNVPRSVNHQDNMARMSFYAYDTIREIDANGFFNDIKINGMADMPVDTEGPKISMAWQGDASAQDAGILRVSISDPQGLYHYNSVIGRSVMLMHVSESGSVSENVNDLFVPAVDDFTRGSLSVPFASLEPGRHLFSIRAWDLHDNSAEDTLSIVISEKPLQEHPLMNVMNYPNPVENETTFSFSYWKKDVRCDISIEIFDVTGRLFTTLRYDNVNEKVNLHWNGLDFYGNRLPSGMYLYNFYLKDTDNDEYKTTQKMIVK